MVTSGTGYPTCVAAHDTDGLVDGRYARRQPLGRGGFGVVWRAHDTLLQRDVAIKEIEIPGVLDPDDVAALRKKVLREARVAARLSHPGAVTVYDVVEEDNRPLIVMELVDAPTLADVVTREGPFSARRAAAIGLAVLDTLVAAHRRGIIHRDVKPANVMLTSDNRVQLADFGIASIIDDPKVTSSGAVAGSPSYMAPEQAQSHGTDPATDLWGLGATLYFAVEGVPPFDKGAAIPTLTAVVHEPPRPLSRPTALGALIGELLAKDPGQRPDPIAVRQRLDAVLTGAGEPTPEAGSSETLELDPALAPAPPPPPPSPSPPDPTAAPAAPPPPAPPAPAPAPRRQPRRTGVIAASVLAVLAALTLVMVLAGRDGGNAPGPAAAPDGGQETPAGEEPVPADWVAYTDPETGFTISHPPGWTIRRNGTLTDFRDPRTGAYLRVDYTRSPGPSPQADWEAFEPRFAAENAGYRRIQITPTSYAGHPASIWEFTYSSGSEQLHAVDLGFVTGTYGFALNFQSRSADWERYQPTFDAFKASFRAPS